MTIVTLIDGAFLVHKTPKFAKSEIRVNIPTRMLVMLECYSEDMGVDLDAFITHLGAQYLEARGLPDPRVTPAEDEE